MADLIEDLSNELKSVRREVDALQIAFTGQNKPWYKDTSTIVAAAALLFSFGTTVVSYRHSTSQDIQSAHQTLRSIIERLSEIPRDRVEANKKYEADRFVLDALGSIYNRENSLLAGQAAEIARSLPKSELSTSEAISIALSLLENYDFSGAKLFADQGEKNAKTLNDEASAIRFGASIEYISGNADSGRKKYAKALDIFLKYPTNDPVARSVTNFYTNYYWADSEIGIGRIDIALKKCDDAENALLAMSPSSSAYYKQLIQLRRQSLRQPNQPTLPLPSIPDSAHGTVLPPPKSAF